MLRGVKPTTVSKRLKALFYGSAGVGKTTCAIQFPRPYLIDTERGAENDQYAKLLDERGGAIFQTADFDDVVREVTTLLSMKHPYKTLIIDPLSGVYADLCDKAAKSLADDKDPEGTAFGRHKAKADRQVKHLMNLLLRLDMNVIITSHAKKLWGPNMTELGNTFDCYSKLDYLFDLVFEVQKRGETRVGCVRKTRCEGFPEAEIFPFTYGEVASRYGAAVLERDATPESLATPEQIANLIRLTDLLKTPEAVVDKWFEKTGASKWEEMPADYAVKCLDYLGKQVSGQPAAEPEKAKKSPAKAEPKD